MSEHKTKGKPKHETIKPGKSEKDELTEKDLEKASGGGRPLLQISILLSS